MQNHSAVPSQPLKSGDIMTLGDAVVLSIEARAPSCKLLLLAAIDSACVAGMYDTLLWGDYRYGKLLKNMQPWSSTCVLCKLSCRHRVR